MPDMAADRRHMKAYNGSAKGDHRAMNNRKQDEGCYEPPFPEDFAERLERFIEHAGLSREEFAQRLGFDYDLTAWPSGSKARS